MIPPDKELVNTVARHPGCTSRELLLVLDREGWDGLPKSQLNSLLYRLRTEGYLDWEPGIGNERRWHCDVLHEDGTQEAPAVGTTAAGELSFDLESFLKGFPHAVVEEPAVPEEIELYDWQREALGVWQDHDHEGVVEAVTGAGKTRVAIAAAADVLRDGGKVAILVPTIDLLHQWKREAERLLIQTLRLNV